jgi:hypothetical protein
MAPKRRSKRPSRNDGRNKLKEIAPNRSRKGKGGQTPRKPKSRDKATDADAKKKKMRDPSTIAAMAALGIGAALAAKIAVESLNNYMASDGASIAITSIHPKTLKPDWVPDWDWLNKLFPAPKNLKISYTVTATGIENNPAILVPDVLATKSNVRVLDTDTVDISGTGVPGLDRKGVPVLNAPQDGGYFVVDSGMKNCSNVHVTSMGTGIINTEMDDHLGEAVEQNASDALSSMTRILGGLGDNLGTIIFIIAICIIAYFAFNLASSIAPSN